MVTLKDIANLDSDKVLNTLGLQRAGTNDWATPSLVSLLVGLATGTALGLLFAQQPGDELRGRLGRKFAQAGAKLRANVPAYPEGAETRPQPSV